MAKVICTLPNASELIGGIKFISHRDGMISQDIPDDQAERLCSIPGYLLAGVAERDANESDQGNEKVTTPRGSGKAKEQGKKGAGSKEPPPGNTGGTPNAESIESVPPASSADPGSSAPSEPSAPPAPPSTLTPGF